MNYTAQIVAKISKPLFFFRNGKRNVEQECPDYSSHVSDSKTEDHKSFTFEEVFGDLCKSNFSTDEAIKYLEVTPTEFHEIQAGNSIRPKSELNGKPEFSFLELSELKMKLNAPQS